MVDTSNPTTNPPPPETEAEEKKGSWWKWLLGLLGVGLLAMSGGEMMLMLIGALLLVAAVVAVASPETADQMQQTVGGYLNKAKGNTPGINVPDLVPLSPQGLAFEKWATENMSAVEEADQKDVFQSFIEKLHKGQALTQEEVDGFVSTLKTRVSSRDKEKLSQEANTFLAPLTVSKHDADNPYMTLYEKGFSKAAGGIKDQLDETQIAKVEEILTKMRAGNVNEEVKLTEAEVNDFIKDMTTPAQKELGAQLKHFVPAAPGR